MYPPMVWGVLAVEKLPTASGRCVSTLTSGGGASRGGASSYAGIRWGSMTSRFRTQAGAQPLRRESRGRGLEKNHSAFLDQETLAGFWIFF